MTRQDEEEETVSEITTSDCSSGVRGEVGDSMGWYRGPKEGGACTALGLAEGVCIEREYAQITERKKDVLRYAASVCKVQDELYRRDRVDVNHWQEFGIQNEEAPTTASRIE